MNKDKLKILLSGGGTGGHIFPAVAIADALKQKYSDAEILFVGAKGRMEMEKVPQAGYNIKGLWISGFRRKLDKRNIAFPFKLISSLLVARQIINDFKPGIAIGTGGYASGPTLYMASRKGVPTLILEQNSYPGITNRLLSRTVDTVCVAYPGMEKYFDKDKIVVTGSPIREQISKSNIPKKKACEFFHLDHKKPIMLIIGGSQGALGINRAISANIKQLCEVGLQILWQTGTESFEESEKLVNDNNLSDHVFVHKFIMRMEMAYAAADFVVSRSGAIALAEIVQLEKPAIFIPLPTAAEDHQTENAMSLVDGGAALVLKEKEAPNKLMSLVNHFMLDENKKSELIMNIRDFKTPDATKAIVGQAVKLLKR